MAIALESAGRVRQKAIGIAVYGGGTTTLPISPYHFLALKALFLHLAANKGNPDLQFVPYTAEQATTNGGYSPDVDACTLYAWFGRARRTSATTAAFETLYDGTTAGDSDVVTTQVAAQRIRLAGQQFLDVWPNGYALATELTIASTTTLGGATESSAANSTDGFVILGA